MEQKRITSPYNGVSDLWLNMWCSGFSAVGFDRSGREGVALRAKLKMSPEDIGVPWSCEGSQQCVRASKRAL